MVFNPEDEQDFGPHCRNCHKGSSRCSACHNTSATGVVRYDNTLGANNATNRSTFTMGLTSTGVANPLGGRGNEALSFSSSDYGFFKKSQTVNWSTDWRNSDTAMSVADVKAICSDDGFSWPHRTLGWKMLKDDLFGLDFDGTQVAVGAFRTDGTTTYTAHDLDSVCLDCHNPTIWNATGPTHVDTPGSSTDNYNDELLTRGLP